MPRPPGEAASASCASAGLTRSASPRATGRATQFEPRHATFAKFATNDQVVVTLFPGPHSYTGETVAEISAHGSPVVLASIVRAAVDAGARMAEPGEFTLRAFLNSKIDLIQAEAVADLIDAVTPLQARAAFDQLEGTLTKTIGEIERDLFDVIAKLEASLDFPDEGYHFVAPREARTSLAGIIARIDGLLAQASRGRLVREGAQVAIVGAPNVGKSSLFNALLNTNRAIVTAIPGTTRDLLTERADIGGLSLSLVDTAGVRDTMDVVEQEGVSRARDTLRVADLAIVVLDRSRPLSAEDRDVLEATAKQRRVVVRNKSDLASVSRVVFRNRCLCQDRRGHRAIDRGNRGHAEHERAAARQPADHQHASRRACSNARAHRSSEPSQRSKARCRKNFRCSISRRPRRRCRRSPANARATICCATSSSVSVSASKASRGREQDGGHEVVIVPMRRAANAARSMTRSR